MFYHNQTNSVDCPEEQKFSLGLKFSEILEFEQRQLEVFLSYTPRVEIIRWLQWNDPNGVYTDNASMSEFGNIMSKDDGVEILKRQVLQSQ